MKTPVHFQLKPGLAGHTSGGSFLTPKQKNVTCLYMAGAMGMETISKH